MSLPVTFARLTPSHNHWPLYLLRQMTIWRVPLAGLSSGVLTKSQQVVLTKFVSARKGDVDAALAMLLNCLKVSSVAGSLIWHC